jgi:endonuclease YncB( thermonuclease family)
MLIPRTLWLALFLGVLGLFSVAGAKEPVGRFTAKVISVVDGDTLKVLKDGSEETVRLFGVDAPEKSQAFGREAKEFTSKLALKKDVTVRFYGKDSRKRILADVILPDERNLNHELVRNGYAWWYDLYAKDDQELKADQNIASASRVGLWSKPKPVAPWLFRQAAAHDEAILSTTESAASSDEFLTSPPPPPFSPGAVGPDASYPSAPGVQLNGTPPYAGEPYQQEGYYQPGYNQQGYYQPGYNQQFYDQLLYAPQGYGNPQSGGGYGNTQPGGGYSSRELREMNGTGSQGGAYGATGMGIESYRYIPYSNQPYFVLPGMGNSNFAPRSNRSNRSSSGNNSDSSSSGGQ